MAWMIGSFVLFIVLVAVALLWLKTRKAADEASAAARVAADQAASNAQEVEKLQRDSAELAAHTYLSAFGPQCVYKLLAKNEIEVTGATKVYGLVELESGDFKPFFVSESMAPLAVGDCFSALRGQLVKLGPEVFGDGATARPPRDEGAEATDAAVDVAAAPDPSASAVAYVEADDADDKTVMYAPDHHRPRAPADPNAGLPYLKVVEGNDEGTLFYLPFGEEATIGRGKSDTVALNDDGASRAHCIVAFTNHRFVLRDNHSTNGTRCNGERITEKVLEFGDTLQVANTRMIFTCKGDELKDRDPNGAIAAFEATLAREPDFLTALNVLAFLLERNIARQKEAAPLWSRITALEKSAG